MQDEVEVTINDTNRTARRPSSSTLFEGVRRMALASLGAAAITRDEVENLVNTFVSRGEIAQKDAEQLVGEIRTRVQKNVPRPDFTPAGIEARVESTVEQILNRLNVPSKRDIDDLSAKIAQLTARVDELRKAQDSQ